MDLMQTGLAGVEWINLAQDKDQKCILMNMVMKLLVS